MVALVRKIMAEATGTLVESKKPPLIEFHAPEAQKVPLLLFVLHTETHMSQGEGLVQEQELVFSGPHSSCSVRTRVL